MRRSQTRGDRNVHWIERYCLAPHGPERGQRVCLTPAQRDIIRRIYNCPDRPQQLAVTGPLAAYLALLHVCGPEAMQREFRPELRADLFTVWAATSPALKEVLKRDGEAVTCPQLGTRYSAAA